MYDENHLYDFLTEWKDKDLTNYNEIDLREEFIFPLLAFLGYKKNTLFRIERERPCPLKDPFIQIGRKTIKLDYICSVFHKRSVVVEVKSPQIDISKYDISQGYYYCIHSEIRARYLLLTNGLNTQLYYIRGLEAGYKLILNFLLTEIIDYWEDLKSYLSKKRVLNSILSEWMNELHQYYLSAPQNSRNQIIESILPQTMKKIHLDSTPDESSLIFRTFDTLKKHWESKLTKDMKQKVEMMDRMNFCQKMFLILLDLSFGIGIDLFENRYNVLIDVITNSNYYQEIVTEELNEITQQNLQILRECFVIRDSRVWISDSYSDVVPIFHEIDEYKTLLSLINFLLAVVSDFPYNEVKEAYRKSSLHEVISDLEADFNTNLFYSVFSVPLLGAIKYAGQNSIAFTEIFEEILDENDPTLLTIMLQGMIWHYDILTPSQQHFLNNILQNILKYPELVQSGVLLVLAQKSNDLNEKEKRILEIIIANDNKKINLHFSDWIKYSIPMALPLIKEYLIRLLNDDNEEIRKRIMNSLFLQYSNLPSDLKGVLLTKFDDENFVVRLHFVMQLFTIKEIDTSLQINLGKKICEKEPHPQIMLMLLLQIAFKVSFDEEKFEENLKIIRELFPLLKWNVLIEDKDFPSLFSFFLIFFKEDQFIKIKEILSEVWLSQKISLDIDLFKMELPDNFDMMVKNAADNEIREKQELYRRNLQFNFEKIFDIVIPNNEL